MSAPSSPVAAESKKREVPEEAKAEQGSPKKAKAETPVPEPVADEPEAKAEAKTSTEREQLETFLKSLRSELEEVVVIEDRDKIQSKAIDAYFQKRKEAEAESLKDLVLKCVRSMTQAWMERPVVSIEQRDAQIALLVADYQAQQ